MVLIELSEFPQIQQDNTESQKFPVTLEATTFLELIYMTKQLDL